MGSLSRSSSSSLSQSDEACSVSGKFIWQHNGLVTCNYLFLLCMVDQVSSYQLKNNQITEFCIECN